MHRLGHLKEFKSWITYVQANRPFKISSLANLSSVPEVKSSPVPWGSCGSNDCTLFFGGRVGLSVLATFGSNVSLLRCRRSRIICFCAVSIILEALRRSPGLVGLEDGSDSILVERVFFCPIALPFECMVSSIEWDINSGDNRWKPESLEASLKISFGSKERPFCDFKSAIVYQN